MLHWIRTRVTYANVVSSLALFLVVGGGTAFAIAQANSVNSQAIIDGQVKSVDIGTGAVGPTKVKNETLTGLDVADSSLFGGKELAPNSVGGGRIADNSVKGADVDESTLSGITVASAFGGNTDNAQLTAPGTNGSELFAPAATYGATHLANNEGIIPEAVSPPFTTVARDLAVRYPSGTASVAFGHGIKISLRVGTTTTPLSCTIVGTNAVSCANTTTTVSVPASSMLKIVIAHDSGTGGAGAGNLRWSWRLVTP